MKIKTEKLVKLVNLAFKAAGNNKIIPITQMIGIKASNGKLTLSATDSFNYLYTSLNIESNDNINICVNGDILSKLINKFTSEFTDLELKENYLLVVGNGEYKLDLLLDEEGIAYKFPEKKVSDNANFQEIETSKFVNLKFYGEKSLAQTMEEPDLIAYYVNNDLAISTDRNIMSLVKDSISTIPLTLRSKFVDLLVLLKDKIKFYNWTNETTKEVNLYVTDGETEIYSKVNNNVNDYPYEAIQSLIENSVFKIEGIISIKSLQAALDRISLMVTPYDSNVIDLKLNDGRLFISSIKSTGVEVIELKNTNNQDSWVGKIDIEMLRSQLSSFSKDGIKIYLGNDTCIKLSEDNVIKLICLVESYLNKVD